MNHGEPMQQGGEANAQITANQLFTQMQYEIACLRERLNQAENQHHLGAKQAQAPDGPQPAQVLPPLPGEEERQRLDQVMKIMRTAPKFYGNTQEP